MKKLISIFTTIVALPLLFVACSDDNEGSSNLNSLGDQIDRMGRPAINTALNKTFTTDDVRGAAEDTYNTTALSASTTFTNDFADSLAIYDALVDEGDDGNACGDNALTNRASANPDDNLATGENRYNFLASVLADDQLYINASASGGSEAGECNQYLAAELTVIGQPGLENDCGGRTPNQDVIATTYSAVAAGGVSGVDDGVAADNSTHSETEFPFLAAPNN